MDKISFENKLNELVREVAGRCGDSYQTFDVRGKDGEEKPRDIDGKFDHLQDCLDYLRVYIKYQLFDLEATRRENKYLRAMLEEKDA